MCGINAAAIGLWANLAMPMAGCGMADISKHMFLFINMEDILIGAGFIMLARAKNRTRITAAAVTAALVIGCNFTLPESTVTFGSFEGSAVKWIVYDTLSDGSQILVTKNPVASLPFDGEDNIWLSSDLKLWLNEEFLKDFTAEERGEILPYIHAIPLTADRKDKAFSGNHVHIWNLLRESADEYIDTSYKEYIEDLVYIPTIEMTKNLKGGNYWILCPYGAKPSMERYVSREGFVLHTDVKAEKGVRAVIRRAAR